MATRVQRTSSPATLLPSKQGFSYRGISYEGLWDRARLPLKVRLQIASWAMENSTPSAVQIRLIMPESVSSKDPFIDNALLERLFEYLTNDEIKRILEPPQILNREIKFPLSISQAAQVLGNVTANQLRDWDASNIAPAARDGSSQYRGYYRAHLLVALLVSKALKNGFSMQDLKDSIKPEERRDRRSLEYFSLLWPILGNNSD